MDSYIKFKNKCSLDFGIRISKKNIFSAPARDLSTQQIPGRNSSLLLDNGRYNDTTITYSCFVKSSNIPEATSKIKAWLLSDVKKYPVSDSYDPDFLRYGYVSAGVEFDDAARRASNFDIAFTCDPFRYLAQGQNAVTKTEQSAMINPFEFDALPYLKVYGSGFGAVYIGGKSIQFLDINEFVEVDCESKNAYKGITNLNNKINCPDFPAFKPGKNEIEWSGGITKIEIIPRWCTL